MFYRRPRWHSMRARLTSFCIGVVAPRSPTSWRAAGFGAGPRAVGCCSPRPVELAISPALSRRAVTHVAISFEAMLGQDNVHTMTTRIAADF